ncbi:MAG TPA: RNA-binding protein [Xanthobacteraceae bacterium]|jgi:predicted RNA-binding protein YlxR (DUF448 family)|nr:RNA-binding protein [Xanthobacteraceae bacterium]
MQGPATDIARNREPHAAAAVTERLCIATREVRPVGELIRFVVGPEGAVVPDLKRRLPGRGVWITAHRRFVESAVRRRAFGRAFNADVRVSSDLPDELERLLERSALDALSIARKAGLVVLGFAKVEAAVAAAPLVALIRARDAGAESGHRLAAAFKRRADDGAKGKIVEAFTSAQLDLALGRLNVVHAALLAGRASETFLARWRFLESFRADNPGDRDRGSRQQNGTHPEPGS